jgi:hypothetical protein
MMLSRWLKELRQATSTNEVVAFASKHLDRVKSSGQLPLYVADRAVAGPEDVLEIASELAHRPFMYNAPGHESGVDQQLLILFSLAADRLSQLGGRGIVRRTVAPVIRAR